MRKTAFLIIILTIISKILGFGREITLSYFYGVSNISDAYLISSTIPTFVFALIGTGLAASYIPMYNKIAKEGGDLSANKFTNNLINLIIVGSTLIIIFTLIFTKPIVKLFASGFDNETLGLAVTFTRISILGIYFSGLGYILKSYLQIKGSFVAPALVGLPYNFFIISSIVLSFIFDSVLILPIGIVTAFMFQVIFLMPSLKRNSYTYKATFNIKDRDIRKMVYLSLPVIIGVSANEINSLVDRTLASQIAVGGISALSYASTLNSFIQGIFSLSIATVIYPSISKMAVNNNMLDLKKTISKAISAINLLVIPSTVGAMIFASPIVSLLFGRGAFDDQAISMTSYALFFYSIGMFAVGIREILSRTFFSLQDTKTPMVNSALALIINIILNIILSKYLGIGGLALATSISAIICSILLMGSLKRKIGPIGIKKISISFLKVTFASILMGLIAKLSFDFITANLLTQGISLLISIIIGLLSYLLLIYLMKIEGVDVILNVVKRKLKR
ncbi:putative peptidoglycan lipid II flippase [Lysinibacillus composti]|uniref:Probable lipid II flippase MurJ n=1 Tax=Lysinibacillus composti TaxID=720633 RepID=A0A3N9UBK4_9BACI|nr:murein biosynthesis integral membrane protein MurJ [Lysinibacillus composti]MBM7610249.1 putative peptidoglycan lipid II flippase [Lysinibacillus composti]RQW73830.1 murein biosynthesis integral membrane protein MurJ [Lysinibacillus composti]